MTCVKFYDVHQNNKIESNNLVVDLIATDHLCFKGNEITALMQ